MGSLILRGLHLLLHAIFFLSTIPANCNEEHDHLLQGLNSYRQSNNQPPLTKNDKAECVAEKVAEELEDQPCPRSSGAQPHFDDYPDVVGKCDVEVNATRDGVVLPVCVSNRVATLVLTNYTQSRNAKYINDSRFTGVGIGSEDDWVVVVLSTNSPSGSFASAAAAAPPPCSCLISWSFALLVLLLPSLVLI